MNKCIAIISILLPSAVVAAEKWLPVAPPGSSHGAPLLNVSYVLLNGYGNRVATLRTNLNGYQMDILTEFDCANRQTRALSSSLTDKAGRLVGATGESKMWLNEKQSLGLPEACEASVTTP